MKPCTTALAALLFAAFQFSPSLAPAAELTTIRQGDEAISVADHVLFNTETIVEGATTLVRDLRDGSVVATVTSRALTPDTAYSIWWAIFNEPQYCATPYDCKVTDLEVFGGDPQVRASVFWGGGFVADALGSGNTVMTLRKGRTARERFAQTKDYGLANVGGAEIHVVLRSHGPASVAGTLATQIGTANEACPPGGCTNVFASIHTAAQR